MSVGKVPSQKEKDTDNSVENETKPHSKSTICFGLGFKLGKRRCSCGWTCLVRYRPS